MPQIPPVNLTHVAEVGSTMELAKEMVRAVVGSPRPFGVIADVQTSGRGTGGRVWKSPKGNLYLSLAVPLHNPTFMNEKLVPVLPLICGLACRRAMARLLPPAAAPALSTKWPNDLIFESKKLGGTLAEGEGDFCIFGMGMNVCVAPPVDDSGRESTSLHAIAEAFHGPTEAITPTSLAEAIWTEMFAIITDAEATRPQVVSAFREVLNMELKLHKRIPEGRDPEPLTAVGLNDWGHLTVRHTDGREETLCSEYLF